MSQNENNRIQELFLAALDRPPEERDQWLVQQCGEDDKLLREVRLLLEHDNADDDPLEQGLDKALEHMPSTLRPEFADDGERSEGMTQLDSELFLSKLSKVGVLSQEEIDALNQTIASGRSSADPRQLASELVARGKLTDYQASALLKGQPELLIDKYLILDLLDAGGMGMVFKAIHRPMNRTVAIKMIAQHLLSSPEQVKRFQREVRVAASLEHPNIVRSYDADRARGVHFLVMEYVRGENLSRIVQRDGPMSVELAVDCIQQAAKGLRHAQKQGVIHRDIKPGNLMLDKDGLVKVLDLGLANIDESFRLAQQTSITGEAERPNAQSLAGSELTSAGEVLGTVSFMAPEQSLDAHKADTRADIYSLGCTLYYLLVGEAPYKGDTIFQVFTHHREAEIPALRSQRPDVPEKVESVCQKMLAKSPEDRYQSMGELLAGIKDCDIAPPPEKETRSASEGPVKAPLSPTVTLASQHTTGVQSKSPAALGWILGFILPCALGIGYWWWQSYSGQGHRAQQPFTDAPSAENGNETKMSSADLRATGDLEWRVVKRLPAPINTQHEEFSADMTEDQRLIALVSDRPGGFGSADLWISARDSTQDEWKQPVNPGPEINTSATESNVVIASDGSALMFTRIDRGVRSRFLTTRTSTDAPWTKPVLVADLLRSLDANHHVDSVAGKELADSPQLAKTYRALATKEQRSVAVQWGGGSGKRLLADNRSMLFAWKRDTMPGRHDIYLAQLVRKDSPVQPIMGIEPGIRDNAENEFDRPLADLLESGQWEWSEPESLVPQLQLSGWSRPIYPDISRDGLTLLFEMADSPGSDNREIFIATRSTVAEKWEIPTRLVSPINTPRNECHPHLSDDGLTLFFDSTNRPGSKTEGKSNIWISTRESCDAAWNEPVAFAFNSERWDSYAHSTSDNSLLVYMTGGEIAICSRKTAQAGWSRPKTIDLPLDDSEKSRFSPCISDDGLQLLFEAWKESGSSELWEATRNSRGEPFGKPRQLQVPNFGSGFSGFSYCPAERAMYSFSSVEGRPVLWVSRLKRSKQHLSDNENSK